MPGETLLHIFEWLSGPRGSQLTAGWRTGSRTLMMMMMVCGCSRATWERSTGRRGRVYRTRAAGELPGCGIVHDVKRSSFSAQLVLRRRREARRSNTESTPRIAIRGVLRSTWHLSASFTASVRKEKLDWEMRGCNEAPANVVSSGLSQRVWQRLTTSGTLGTRLRLRSRHVLLTFYVVWNGLHQNTELWSE